MAGRVPLPKEIEMSRNQKGSEYFNSIPEEIVRKYETAILNNLLKFIKSDEVLMHFHVRLVCECENIRKVIEVADEFDIESLEDIVKKLTTANTVEKISIYDSEFHRTLFNITKNAEFFKWWRLQSEELCNFLGKFWETVGYGTTHYHDLMEIHRRIFVAVRNRDEEAAINAMQDHFAVLLFQLLGTTYNKS